MGLETAFAVAEVETLARGALEALVLEEVALMDTLVEDGMAPPMALALNAS
jgi:hypothetical protein